MVSLLLSRSALTEIPAHVDLEREADRVLWERPEFAGLVVNALTKGGLGLISMEERVHIVSGKFAIGSAPRQGPLKRSCP